MSGRKGRTVVFFAAAHPGAARFHVRVMKGGAEQAGAWVDDSPATVPFARPAPGTKYQVAVGRGEGPPGALIDALLVPPTLGAAAAGDGFVTVEVTAPDAGGVVTTGYRAELLRDGVPVGTSEAPVPGEGGLRVPVGQDVDAAGRYAVAIRALGDRAESPDARRMVVLGAPVVTGARVEGSPGSLAVAATVEAGRLPDPDALELEAVLVVDGVPGTPVPVQDGRATLPILSGAQRVAIAARAKGGGATGPWSKPIPVPVAEPVIAADCDGPNLALRWTGDTEGDYRVEVTADDDSVVAETVASGLSAALRLAAGSQSADTVRVTQLAGVAVGPPGALALVTDGAQVTAATARADRTVTVDWEPPSAPLAGVSAYVPVVFWGGTKTSLSPEPGESTQATFALPASIPGDAAIAVHAVAGRASGPLGTAAPILLAAPTGLELEFDGETLTATWDPATDPRVDGYEVTLDVTGVAPEVKRVTGASCTLALTPPGPPPQVSASVTVAATAGVGTGPPSEPVGALLETPAVTAAHVADGTLALEWSAIGDPGATGYAVALLSGGETVAEVTVGGTSGALALPPGPLEVQVRGVGHATRGPATEPLALLMQAPAIDASAVDAVSGGLTVAWSAATHAEGYAVEVTSPLGAVASAHVTDPRFERAAADLPPSGVYATRVRATASQGRLGPWSAPVRFSTVAPAEVRTEYDGRRARLAWDALPVPGLDGYVVTLLDGSGTVQSVPTAASSVELAVPFDAAKPLTAVVQGVTADGTGSPSPRAPLFHAGLYLSTDVARAPYLRPAGSPAMTDEDVVVQLPQIFATKPVDSNLPTEPPFVFAPAPGPYAYTLTMPSGSAVWSFDTAPVRDPVAKAYATLLQKLTDLQVTALGWRVVQDAIARSMPQTFVEILLYGCGFQPAGGWVDLRPGMVLRAEYETYQYLGPSARNADLLAGYATTSSVDYQVGSYVDPSRPAATSWLIGFDAFLSAVAGRGTKVPAPKTSSAGAAGGGGVADLYYPQLRQPFYRLVYPPNLSASSSDGDPRPAFNVAVLAASDYPTLNDATKALRNAQPLGTGAAATYLRGRTMLTACVRVEVDGRPLTVPVGTTVGGVLDAMGRRAPVVQSGEGVDGLPLAGIRMTRATGYAVPGGADGYDVAGGRPVRLDWRAETGYDATTDWLALPLLPGDRLWTEATGPR